MAKRKQTKKRLMSRRLYTYGGYAHALITFFMLYNIEQASDNGLTMPSNDKNTQDNQKNEAKASE